MLRQFWDAAAELDEAALDPDGGALGCRHLSADPRVSLNFAGDGGGGDIVVLNGTAALRPEDPPADDDPEYLTKYAGHISRIGLTPRSFAQRYSLPLTISTHASSRALTATAGGASPGGRLRPRRLDHDQGTDPTGPAGP